MAIDLRRPEKFDSGNISIAVMIVGAEKAGTSALINHLGSFENVHILLSSGSPRDVEYSSEFPYFLSDNRVSSVQLNSIFRDAIPEHFDSKKHMIFAKNVGMCTDRVALERLYAHSPNVKVIFVLREPVSRAISSHRYQLYRGAEQESDFAIACQSCLDGVRASNRHIDYLNRGLYSQQVSDLLDVFGRSNCIFLRFEEFVEDKEKTLNLLREKIGLYGESDIDLQKVNTAKEPRSSAVAKFLYRESALKSLIRHALPLKARVRVAALIRRLNSRPLSKKSVSVSAELRWRLREHFYRDVVDTEKLTGLSLVEPWGYGSNGQ